MLTRRSFRLLTGLLCMAAVAHGAFIRGDANGDGKADIADAVSTLSYLFARGDARCMAAQDANADGKVDIGDPIFMLAFLFAAGVPPSAPFPACGDASTADNPCRELGCATGCNAEPAAESPWPMFRHDLQHTGRTQFTGPAAPVVAWKFKAREGIVSSPAIGADGTIYFGSGWHFSDAYDNYLYALTPDGNLKWQYGPVKGLFSSPALGAGGMIYITGLDGYLYAIRDTGTAGELAWRTKLTVGFCLSSPAIGADGTIYAGSTNFDFYALAPDGSILWQYHTDWCIISSPAIDSRGTVYVGSKDEKLYAFDAAGPEPKWAFPAGEFYDGRLVDSSPAIGADGTLYFGTDQYGAVGVPPVPSTTNFWAVRPDGTLKWIFLTEDGVESSPAIGRDGTLYFGSYDTYFYAVTDTGTSGELAWKLKTGGAVDGSAAIDGDGTIYFGSRDANLYALRPDGSVRWTFQAGDGIECSPTIDAAGRLYFGSFDGYLYALGAGGPDAGVVALDLPENVTPGSVVTPRAALRNFRGAARQVEARCVIEADGVVVYSDTQSVEIPGGAGACAAFSPWSAPLQSAVYKITTATQVPGDENPDNDARSAELRT